MYLNHDEIESLIASGYMLGTDPGCVNTASLDVRLGDSLLIERICGNRTIDYSKREKPSMIEVRIPDDGIEILSGQFFLAHTIERCNFPDDMAALFRIKSSMGRCGIEHLDAGWVDPGFNGSLTLEFKFMLRYHSLILHKGDRIGQLIFMRGNKVDADKSYRARGNYNGSTTVKEVGYK